MQPTHFENPNYGQQRTVSLWEAIGDLPPLIAGGGSESMSYDRILRNKQLKQSPGRYLLDVLEIDQSNTITAHRARPHNPRDLRDFSRLKEGETGAQAIARGIALETPYNQDTFKDRYTRQHRDNLCSTMWHV